MKNNLKSIAIIALALAVMLLGMAACAPSAATPQPEATADPQPEATVTPLADGGTLLLRVNPEIAVDYDNDGMVTGITAKNDDALKIIANYSGFSGKHTKTVVAELVKAIGEAGYFVEELDGSYRQLTIEVEAGSVLPSDRFLDDVVADVKSVVSGNMWQTPLDLKGTSDYGMTDYIDTDYGPGNDGNTDYNDSDYGPNGDGVTDYDHNIKDDTDYGEGSDGITDYDGTDYANNTDYGVNADGNTDYNDSDYGIWGDGVTDYDHNIKDDTDYGEGSDGITDYDGTDYANNTDYGVNADGNTDYNDSDYGVWGDGVTDYVAPTTSKPASGSKPSGSSKPSYGSSDSGYSNYGNSGYSGYGES